jgi:hypothetical protein
MSLADKNLVWSRGRNVTCGRIQRLKTAATIRDRDLAIGKFLHM